MMKRWGLLAAILSITVLFLSGCAVVVGPPRGQVVVAPPPPIVVEREPRVVLIPDTDVYYAPDVTVNLYVVGGVWYYFHDDHWFRGRSHRGPWIFVEERRVPRGLKKIPPGFRKHKPGKGGMPPGQMKKRERERGDD